MAWLIEKVLREENARSLSEFISVKWRFSCGNSSPDGQSIPDLKIPSQLSWNPALGPDGTLYIGGLDKKVYALDSRTGSVKWSSLTDHPNYCGAAVDGTSMVYIGSSRFMGDSGKIYAFDAQSGEKKWEVQTSEIAVAPVIGPDGTVYVMDDWSLFALDPHGGNLIWKIVHGTFQLLPPVVGQDGTIYLMTGAGLRAIHGKTGETQWTLPSATPHDMDLSGASALDDNGILYVGMELEGEGNSADPFQFHAIDSRTGKSEWSAYRDNSFHRFSSGPVIGPDTTIYAGNNSGKVCAFDGASGARKWSTDIGNKRIYSRLNLGIDGVVLVYGHWELDDNPFPPGVSTEHHERIDISESLYALSSETGKILWKYNFRMGNRSASPVVGPDGTLFIIGFEFDHGPSLLALERGK